MDLFSQFLLVIVPLLAWVLFVDIIMIRYTSSIDVEKINKKAQINTLDSDAKVPPLPKIAKGEDPTVVTKYIVTGGSGFIGSWIARFLIFRGAKDITVLDAIPKSPSDLVNHGVKFDHVDLRDKKRFKESIEKHVLKKTPKKDDNDQTDDNSKQSILSSQSEKGKRVKLVIFHCAAVQRHFIGWRFFDKKPADANVTMAENLVDILDELAIEFNEEGGDRKNSSITVINIADAQSDYEAPLWWRFWTMSKWRDTYKRNSKGPRKYLSSYAQSKNEAEEIILSSQSTSYNEEEKGEKTTTGGTKIYSISLRVQGIVTGYYGEPILSPAIYYGGLIDHSWSIPTSFIHVEDVARAALLAENAITEGDDEKKKEIVNHSFVVSTGQVLRFGDDAMDRVLKSESMRDIRINPAVVNMISHFASNLVYLVGKAQLKWMSRDSSVYSGYWWTLTPQRFDTIQTVQLPVPEEIAKTRKAIGFTATVSSEDALSFEAIDFEKHKTAIRENVVKAMKKKEMKNTSLVSKY